MEDGWVGPPGAEPLQLHAVSPSFSKAGCGMPGGLMTGEDVVCSSWEGRARTQVNAARGDGDAGPARRQAVCPEEEGMA